MAEASKSSDVEQTRIVLGLLEYVERGGEQSQRRLASELGVALGLANAYLKRCIKKGLVKVRQAPARRYAYYLTPHGFSEKSRLTVEFMTYSFTLFRRAKIDCMAALQAARERGYARIALLGASDLAEIAAICALDGGFTIVAVVDPKLEAERFAGAPVVRDMDLLPPPDAVLVTDMRSAAATFQAAMAKFGAERVLAPALLGVQSTNSRGTA
jgi:DNA-binding MarR family transcriptional regulator